MSVEDEICGACGLHKTFHDDKGWCVSSRAVEQDGAQISSYEKYLQGVWTFSVFRYPSRNVIEFNEKLLRGEIALKHAVRPHAGGALLLTAKKSDTKRLCECGAWSTGLRDKEPGHSHWCPAKS
jgi:hypothetical protein